MFRALQVLSFVIAAILARELAPAGEQGPFAATIVVSLDGAADWQVAFDPANVGREEKWWLYLHDHWFANHPIANGLRPGTLLDYTFHRNIIADSRWSGLDVAAELVAACVLWLLVSTLPSGTIRVC